MPLQGTKGNIKNANRIQYFQMTNEMMGQDETDAICLPAPFGVRA